MSVLSTAQPTVADQLLWLAEAEECRRSLKVFTQAVWPIVEPGTPFVDGWCLDAIIEHLEAISNGDIRFLLINIPPRHTKSTIGSVIWPIWDWIRSPAGRFLCASYSMDLSTRDNRRKRNLIEHPWFQQRFGNVFQLAGDQNVKRFFENDHKGYHLAVSVGSSATGSGGNRLVIDDPHPAGDAHSETERESAVTWFRETWSTRLNNQETDAMVVIGQRIHQHDVSGYIIEERPDWTHLNLPAQYEQARHCTTAIGWSDPRTVEGELLWPERFSDATLAKLEEDLGPLGYAAQYGQQPVPPGGYVFKMENERLFTIDHDAGLYLLETPQGIRSVPIADCWTCTTSDVAVKAKEQNDFTVFATWAVTPQYDVLLLEVKRDHWTIPQQKEQAKKVFYAWDDDLYRCIYFEDVGYQSAICQDLLIEGIPGKEFVPKGDKLVRATSASIWQGAGKVYFLKHAHWLEVFRKEIYLFPMGKHDDQVDPLSMICMIIRRRRPGLLDLEADKTRTQTSLSIEQVLKIEAEQAEQAELTEEEAKAKEEELYKIGGLNMNPWEWAAEHESGGGWE
jgi:predicted phage terminase large subunit-like protein